MKFSSGNRSPKILRLPGDPTTKTVWILFIKRWFVYSNIYIDNYDYIWARNAFGAPWKGHVWGMLGTDRQNFFPLLCWVVPVRSSSNCALHCIFGCLDRFLAILAVCGHLLQTVEIFQGSRQAPAALHSTRRRRRRSG